MPEHQEISCEGLHELGYQHQLMGEWEEAKRYYQQALERNPDYALAQLALAQLTMMQSGFHEGRDLYEARFAARKNEGGFDWRSLPLPRWRGESIKGKHLHLWVEQGFGDVIMYAGFLPWLLAQQPARITLSMFPKMMTLFARSFPQISVESLQDIGNHALSPAILELFPVLLKQAEKSSLPIDLGPMKRDYEQALKRGKPDYTAPMGDLMVYGLPGFIPAQHSAYLTADPERIAETRKRLQSLGTGRLVGISWHTSNKESGSTRSIPLEQWLPILNTPGCHFISLQHHVPSLEIEQFCIKNNCRIMADSQFDPIQDTEGLAALVACMDEVITIDNSNVHLAGALGVSTTLILPKGCDFRWPVLKDSADTLWYNNVKIERQEHLDWQPVIQRVTAGLGQRIQPKAFAL